MRITQKDLEKLTVKELLGIAKRMQVKGRHEMKKAELVFACTMVDAESEPKEIPQNVDFETELANELEPKEIQQMWNGGEIEANTPAIKVKNDYIDNIKLGTLVAFRINEKKLISGMIEQISVHDFKVRTRNGIAFSVRRKNIVWVKTGARWPRGIYLELKGVNSDECKSIN